MKWIAPIAVISGLIVGGVLGAASPQALAVLQNTLKVQIAHSSCSYDAVESVDCDCEGQIHADLLASEIDLADSEYDAEVTGTNPTYTVTFDYLPGCATAYVYTTSRTKGTVCPEYPPAIGGITNHIFVTDQCQ